VCIDVKKNKKYIIVLIDGAADYKIEELGGLTPLQAAKKPGMDWLSDNGITGIVKTIPEGISPGSDTANLSILGYDPLKYSTGRSSLEAVSIGIKLSDDDITYRCNLVTLSDEPVFEDKKMVDYSAGEISTVESRKLIECIAENFNTANMKFYPGVSYRHVVVFKNGSDKRSSILIPPHDISGKDIREHLPRGEGADLLLSLMKDSVGLLKNHPVNIERIKSGKNPANSIWIWGRAGKPALDSFSGKYEVTGAIISAVDLIKGMGICADLEPVTVEGATGTIHTNFEGKADAAVKQLNDGKDFVYIHLEAPDECSHQGNTACKVRSIELIDVKVIMKIKEQMEKSGFGYRIMVLPDHPTPLSRKTHTAEPVPFLVYDSEGKAVPTRIFEPFRVNSRVGSKSRSDAKTAFDEFCALDSGIVVDPGYKLMDLFLK
jgi:2,3-bisphosphoglycerate-independent phosphoglycerate mutase